MALSEQGIAAEAQKDLLVPRKVLKRMRTLSYANLFRYGAGKCENLVLMCIDFRFQVQAGELLRYAGYRDYDLVCLPGASKAISDASSRQTVFHAIEVALEAQKVKRLIIVDHADCRAYGGSEAFSSPEEEEAFHAEALGEAEKIVRSRHGSLEVIRAYMDWAALELLE